MIRNENTACNERVVTDCDLFDAGNMNVIVDLNVSAKMH